MDRERRLYRFTSTHENASVFIDFWVNTMGGQIPSSMSRNLPALAIAALIILSGLTAIPFGTLSIGVNSGFLPAYGSLTCMGDLITAALLLGQARAMRDAPRAWLGGAYLFASMTIIPCLLAFPGVFGSTSLIGNSASAVWLWLFWHGGFAIGVINFALRKRLQSGSADFALWPIFLVVVALSTALTLLAILGDNMLPNILENGSYARMNTLGISPAVLACAVMGLILVALQLRQPSILATWLTVAMLASVTDVALTMLGTGRFTYGWYLARCLGLVSGFSVLLALLKDFMTLFNKVTTTNGKFERLSLTDPLTEIPNRRQFEQRLQEEWRGAFREQLPLSLVMIDIDHFKRYNDRFGHPAGDECLKQVAASLTRSARRPWDTVARLGGEEFAVLLPKTEAREAAKVANWICTGIRELGLLHPDSVLNVVTISAGVATMYPHAPGESSDGLVKAADEALYVAKTSGRDQACQHVVPERQRLIDEVRKKLEQL